MNVFLGVFVEVFLHCGTKQDLYAFILTLFFCSVDMFEYILFQMFFPESTAVIRIQQVAPLEREEYGVVTSYERFQNIQGIYLEKN